VKYLIGTMIEVPRAALIAAQIAEFAEFFSFGTNDLTQLTYGYSRDDVAKFLPKYLDMGLVRTTPSRSSTRRGRRDDQDRHRAGPESAAESEDRDLRRARRRGIVGRVLPPRENDVRVVLAVPHSQARGSRRRRHESRSGRWGAAAITVCSFGSRRNAK
jgi:hypothetical protein